MKGVLEIPDTLEIYRGDNFKIIELLTKCNALHLWQVPRPANTEARIAAVSGVSQASDTNGTPTDPDSSIKAALKAGHAAAERKVSAIQDTKRDLKSRLAVVEEAETAVLGAQKAMEKSDTALLQSLMSLLAMDNY
ncbi:hypothetical protein ISF_08320 [Cordyceps fumosorosea ARSEF 2679]|uniref:Uncharacterized protein n=1 Tax=Cordyceps fumosorosea (strain ARSEF 2679) TaxID=1081104 RepID=A0A167MIA3_CORFA|nr:hypothetical protein ISF_08320 [Cordyceps fumosorosea ARSEF 2679]OAA54392.1 hypothetical protein ISF_08320 [Cordyceps fumosorosea ARSEF 2679]